MPVPWGSRFKVPEQEGGDLSYACPGVTVWVGGKAEKWTPVLDR